MSPPTRWRWNATSRWKSRAGPRPFVTVKKRRKSSMCGIVGIAGTRDVAPVILEALKRLEYRGYDSAGIATLEGGAITRRRAPGKLKNLGKVLEDKPLHGHTGI